MKSFLKWSLRIGLPLIVVLFLAFLYFIPPFMIAPPETFSTQNLAQGPALDDIKDPAVRLLAERGKYIVVRTDCNGCHTSIGDKGPKWDEYLAGGGKGFYNQDSLESYCRNLTPDPATGLARRSDDEVLRVLQTGLFPEGRQANWRRMPWPFMANWTPEDRYAVLVYLRHLKPVKHAIPDIKPGRVRTDPKAMEEIYGGDYAGH